MPPIHTASEFYDRLGLDSVVEEIYGPRMDASVRARPIAAPLSALKATFRTEFIASLESRYSVTELNRIANHTEHSEFTKEFEAWLNREIVAVLQKTSNQHINSDSKDGGFKITSKGDQNK